MSNVRKIIDAAREGNAAQFEKLFAEETSARLGSALEAARAASYRNILGLSEASETDDEDYNENDELEDTETEED